MAKQLVNIGSAPNDGTGDPLRNAFDKINDNFNELYQGLGDGTALGLALDSDGNVDVSNDLTVTGDLTVSGTYFTVNTETVEFEDNILNLNRTQGSPDTATATTSGISIYRGDGVTEASFIFDDSDDTWDLTNNLVVAGNFTANSIIKSGGTSSEFLKADGSLDSNSYLTTESDTLDSVTDRGNTTTNAITVGEATITGDLTVDTNTLYVDSANNNVGIGTAPNASYSKLQIKSNETAYALDIIGRDAGTLSESQITFWNSDQTVVIGAIGQINGELIFSSGSSASERMKIHNGGDISFRDTSNNEAFYWDASAASLGIGTDSIAANLHIRDTGSTSSIFLDSTATTDQQNRIASLRSSGGAYSSLLIDANTHIFRTGTTERMRIDSSGRVGINQTSPASYTSVAANDLVIGDASGNRGITLSSGTTGYGAIAFADGTATDSQYRGLIQYGHTADSMQFYTGATEKMRIISSGNVGIGTTSPSANLHISGTSDTGLRIKGGSSALSYIDFDDADSGTPSGSIAYNHIVDAMTFSTGGSNAERMRIDSSGNVLVNTTSTIGSDVRFAVRSAAFSETAIECSTTYSGASNKTMVTFIDGSNDTCGSIFINPSSNGTNYQTSSDYRLKEDAQDFDGLSMINNINVYDFKWKKSDKRSYGVFAHELQEVLPQAVGGEKDGKEMQGVDYSKIVPILTKALQEQQEIINDLKARIEILENQ